MTQLKTKLSFLYKKRVNNNYNKKAMLYKKKMNYLKIYYSNLNWNTKICLNKTK